MGKCLYTWQDAALPLPDGWAAEVELELEYHFRRGEAATWENPGWPDSAEIVDAKVRKITLYDDAGEPVDGLAFGIDPKAVLALWWLHCEAIAEELERYVLDDHAEQEQGAREAAAEAYFDARHELRIANTRSWERGEL